MKKIILLLLFIPLFFSCSSGSEEPPPPPIKYTLTMVANPEIGGTVTPASAVYDEGTKVTITATAKTNWEFAGWSGGNLTGNDPTKEIIIDNNRTVTATFVIKTPFYLDDNGVTIKAIEGVTPGLTGQLNGITYTAVDRSMLIEKLRAGEDVSKVVTTLITQMQHPYDLVDLLSKDFNQDISGWDVSNVTNMNGFFLGAHSFNRDISNWDVSKVTNMGSMFIYARAFNKDISSWDTSKVTTMQSMFYEAYNFNKDISSWDTSNLTNMSGMFSGRGDNLSPPLDDMEYNFSNFNQDISSWDVSNVTDMSYMFSHNNTFNQNISKWDVSKVIKMGGMFNSALKFNQDIGNWNVKEVTDMKLMFGWAKKFNQDLTKWCVTNINEEPYMFANQGVLENENKPIWGTCP